MTTPGACQVDRSILFNRADTCSTAMDHSQDRNAIGTRPINDAIGKLEQLAKIGIGALGYQSASMGKLSQLTSPADKSVNREVGIQRGGQGDVGPNGLQMGLGCLRPDKGHAGRLNRFAMSS